MLMTYEEAIEYVKPNIESYLNSKGIDTSKNFSCITGSHKDKNPSMSLQNDEKKKSYLHCHCFSCNANLDIFDCAQYLEGISREESFSFIFNLYDVQIENSKIQNHNKIEQKKAPEKITQAQELKDYSQDFSKWNQALENDRGVARSYLEKRCIATMISKFNLGYAEDLHFISKSGKECHFGKAIIIPTSKNSFNARLIYPQGDMRYIKQGESHLFNLAALYKKDRACFIVEGEIDAMSIESVGGNALALGSIAEKDELIKQIKIKAPESPLILSLDNDKKGIETTEALKTDLDSLGIFYQAINISGSYKDANELLSTGVGSVEYNGFKALSDNINNAETLTLKGYDDFLNKEKNDYLETSTAYGLQSFIDEIESRKDIKATTTGFKNLDDLLEGGLFSGLYVVGAISSLGKTTFCLQVADNIAQSGKDVLIFSLEMSKNELIAKSLSRESLLSSRASGYTNSGYAKTTRSILNCRLNSENDRANLQKAVEKYYSYAKNIYIHIGIGNIGVSQVRAIVEKHIRLTGKTPVVLIDYLQILAPYSDYGTDKQNTDKNILELKRLSRDYDLTLIGISSFNRENYTAPVNLASFKESGAIEYSSDVLMALQYSGMDYQEGESEKARDKRIRDLINENIESGKKGNSQKIQLKVLKNRNGSKGDTELSFIPMFNLFEEPESSEDNNWSTYKK